MERFFLSVIKYPIEWILGFCAILFLDLYYYKTKKRPTLTKSIKNLRRDPLMTSIIWAVWSWLTYHLLIEGRHIED